MGLPLADNPLFAASLVKLELSRGETSPNLGLVYEVEVRNRVTSAFAILRARDLPPDLQSHLQELVAMVEQHAGERLFATEN